MARPLKKSAKFTATKRGLMQSLLTEWMLRQRGSVSTSKVGFVEIVYDKHKIERAGDHMLQLKYKVYDTFHRDECIASKVTNSL